MGQGACYLPAHWCRQGGTGKGKRILAGQGSPRASDNKALFLAWELGKEAGGQGQAELLAACPQGASSVPFTKVETLDGQWPRPCGPLTSD